jgi:ubiquinone/menaquinone biosynthesis C-methylase UbiE
MALRCPAETLTSIDIRSFKDEGERRFPGVRFLTGDARSMPFASNSFDLVFSSTVFYQIIDDQIAAGIAREMRRVCRGHIVVREWTAPAFGRPVRPMNARRIRALFGEPVFSERGAIFPPLGRTLSRFAPWAYFAGQPLLPWPMRVYVI